MVEKFNDTSMIDGPVPKTGTSSSAMPKAPPKATGTPAAVQKADGTANPRADTKTKQAPLPTTPTGGKTHYPAGVTSYKDTL